MAEAGGNVATFHIEVMADQAEAAALAADIRALGMRPGIALSPETPAEAVSGLVASGAVDLVLVMSVKPGFGGQAFMPHTMDKVRQPEGIRKGGNTAAEYMHIEIACSAVHLCSWQTSYC